MPGFKTHSIFGTLSARHLTDGYIKKCIRTYPHSYQMGQQGPDFMFYYAPLHIFNKKNPGDIMHSKSVNKFFQALFESRDLVEKGDQSIVDSYISGFIGHYTLDSAIHPYIYFRTNHMLHEGQKTYDFGVHSFLETDVDQACLRHFMKMDVLDYKPWEKISMSSRELIVISRLLASSINKTYAEITISDFTVRNALKAMKYEQFLMKDPHRKKKDFLRIIDCKTVHHAFLSPMVPYRGKPYYEDPCNMKHRRWHNPWEVAQSTSDDLFKIIINSETVLNRRLLLYQSFVCDKDSEVDKEILLSDLGNCSYLTGLPLG